MRWLLGVALSISFFSAQAETERDRLRKHASMRTPWQADLSTEDGRRQIAWAKRLRFEAQTKSLWTRSPQELLGFAKEFDDQFHLTDEQRSMEFTRYEFTYEPVTVIRTYSEQRVQRLRDQLKEVVRETLPAGKIITTSGALKNTLERLKEQKVLFQRLFLLWPLASGPNYIRSFQREYFLNRIDALTAEELDKMYNGTWKDELLVQLDALTASDQQKTGRWTKWIRKKFYQEMIAPAFQMDVKHVAAESGAHIRIESTPTLVALERGDWGFDCSRWSVPFYVLSKKARVFSFWTSDSESPDGYAFVVEVKVQGKTVPYVLTINGNSRLKFASVRGVLKSIAKIYGSPQFLVPDFNKDAPSVVNSTLVKSAMTFSEAEKVGIEWPEDWEAIREFTASHPNMYTDAYGDDQLKSARFVNAETDEGLIGELSEPEISRHFYPRLDSDLIPKQNKTPTLADYFTNNEGGNVVIHFDGEEPPNRAVLQNLHQLLEEGQFHIPEEERQRMIRHFANAQFEEHRDPQAAQEAIRNAMPPAFLNRITNLYLMNPLSDDVREKIESARAEYDPDYKTKRLEREAQEREKLKQFMTSIEAPNPNSPSIATDTAAFLQVMQHLTTSLPGNQTKLNENVAAHLSTSSRESLIKIWNNGEHQVIDALDFAEGRDPSPMSCYKYLDLSQARFNITGNPTIEIRSFRPPDHQ